MNVQRPASLCPNSVNRAIGCALGLMLAGSLGCADATDEVAVIDAPICVEHSPTLWGIDVSKWQGNIDWLKVKAAGVQYAFIRVSDGITTIDEKFPQNWAGAQANGIPRGVYQFFRPNRDALTQAQIVLDHLAVHGMGELPPVIDVEATGDQTPAVVAQQVGIWIDAIERSIGVRPIIYSGSYFWDDNVKSTAFSDYPLWIPHYTTAACPRLPAPWSDWAFWQYSSTGAVNGIAGNCDMNRYAGTLEQLLALVPDETCRLDPDWRECADDVESYCEDGQVVSSACGANRSCLGPGCVIDQPEPQPEPQPEVVESPPEPSPEVVEPTPEPEVVELQPESVEPAPDTTQPETAQPDASSAADTATNAQPPSRSVSRREVVPASGCGAATDMASFFALLAVLAWVGRRRYLDFESFE